MAPCGYGWHRTADSECWHRSWLSVSLETKSQGPLQLRHSLGRTVSSCMTFSQVVCTRFHFVIFLSGQPSARRIPVWVSFWRGATLTFFKGQKPTWSITMSRPLPLMSAPRRRRESDTNFSAGSNSSVETVQVKSRIQLGRVGGRGDVHETHSRSPVSSATSSQRNSKQVLMDRHSVSFWSQKQ